MVVNEERMRPGHWLALLLSSPHGGADSMISNIAPRVNNQMRVEEAVQRTTKTVIQTKAVPCLRIKTERSQLISCVFHSVL